MHSPAYLDADSRAGFGIEAGYNSKEIHIEANGEGVTDRRV
jgi:hypothetical protein